MFSHDKQVVDDDFIESVNAIINGISLYIWILFSMIWNLFWYCFIDCCLRLRTIGGKFIFIICIFVLVTYKKIEQRNGMMELLQEVDNIHCKNDEIGMFTKEGYSCWCTPDYVGNDCQTKKPVSFMSHITSLLGHENSDESWGRPSMWWGSFLFTSGHKLKTVYAFHQSVVKRLVSVSAGTENDGYAARILPPEFAMEYYSLKKYLPRIDKLYNDIFKREPGQFIPDQNNRNLLYNAFYQYFVLQFFDANSNLAVTASQLYGSDPVSERSMRSFYGGKLKTQTFNYKHYTPNQKFALRSNVFLNAFRYFENIITELIRNIAWKFKRSEMLSTSSFVMSTLWVREHNRVCDELSRKSPSWTDEELYTTARKVVTGQMMTIMMNEILNVELRPEVNHHRMENFIGSSTPIELYLTMAVSSLPEELPYSSTQLTSFSNTRQVSEAGLINALKYMVNSKMGMITAHNDGALTEHLTRTLITLSRGHCLQGFNNYRRLLGLPAYISFFDLTGNEETAKKLKMLYVSVEDVELLTGILTEKSSSGALPTAKMLSNSFIINAILTNKLTAKHSWAPDTFGGVEFFELVKSTSLESLVYRNVDVNRDELQVHLYAK